VHYRQRTFPASLIVETSIGLLAIVERSATCPESRLLAQVKRARLSRLRVSPSPLSHRLAAPRLRAPIGWLNNAEFLVVPDQRIRGAELPLGICWSEMAYGGRRCQRFNVAAPIPHQKVMTPASCTVTGNHPDMDRNPQKFAVFRCRDVGFSIAVKIVDHEVVDASRQ
jgi:hypothetical protein